VNTSGSTGPPQEEKKKPADQLGQEIKSAGIEDLQSKLQRWAVARRRTVEMEGFITTCVCGSDSPVVDQIEAAKAAAKLSTCGEWLALRHYWQVDQLRLIAGEFCQQTKLCMFCAIRRGSRNMSVYLKRYEFLVAQNPRLKAYMVTLTVLNGPDLLERMKHLKKCFKRLLNGMRQSRSGSGRGRSPFAGVSAGVASFEITNRGKGWHPHVHCIVLAETEPDQQSLSAYWLATSGDSFVVDVRAIDPVNPVSGFCEVFKYSMKFQGMALSDNWQAHLDLKGYRLLMGFGGFYGVKLPKELTDDPLEDQPYVDLFFRYLAGCSSYTYDKNFAPSQPTVGGRILRVPLPAAGGLLSLGDVTNDG
jgi:hypothetical protein